MSHQRNVALCILFTVITCGIYGIYWTVMLNDETNQITGETGASGGMVILFSIITCGIYYIFWAYKTGEKLDAARARSNTPAGSFAILFLVLAIFQLGIINLALMQNELNKYTLQ